MISLMVSPQRGSACGLVNRHSNLCSTCLTFIVFLSSVHADDEPDLTPRNFFEAQPKSFVQNKCWKCVAICCHYYTVMLLLLFLSRSTAH